MAISVISHPSDILLRILYFVKGRVVTRLVFHDEKYGNKKKRRWNDNQSVYTHCIMGRVSYNGR